MEITAADTNLTLALTPREVEIIRMALRAQEDNHKKNGFPVLVLEVSDLRSKIADSLLTSQGI